MSLLKSRQSMDESEVINDDTLSYSASDSSDEEAQNGEKLRRDSLQGGSSSNGSDLALSGKSMNMQNIRFRAKKHLIGRLNNRKSLRLLIGRRASACLKSFEDLVKLHIKNPDDQKRLFQSVVKSLGKLGVIAKQGNLSEDRMEIARKLKQELRLVAMVICTFARTQYTYDREHLVKQVISCEQNLHTCVAGLLSDKSIARLHYVFGVLKEERLMDQVFSPTASKAQREALLKFAQSIETALEGSISGS